MNRDPWPTDAARRREWLAAIVGDIDKRDPTRPNPVLDDLLRAAWPSWLAQDQ